MDALSRFMKGAHPDIRELARRAHKQKFIVSRTSRHIRVTARVDPPLEQSQAPSVLLSRTPSDAHAVDNARAQLRRIGVQFPDRQGKKKRKR